MNRFTTSDVVAWRETGFAMIPGFFKPAEITPILHAFEQRYGQSARGDGLAMSMRSKNLGEKGGGTLGEFRDEQFRHLDMLPYPDSIALNLISLHPALIKFAAALLGVPDVHLYQSHTWAKFTGEADYEQDFHCDFGNHTLLVPSDEIRYRSVDFIFYITDVTDDLGALHYVLKSDSDEVLGPGRIGAADPDKQRALKARELSAAGPAGTLIAHGIDTFHRGTNLTRDQGVRYTMTVGYKAAGNDMIGFHVWQQAADRDWSLVLRHATPAQLKCLGIPEPGHDYWTPRTLSLTRARWPQWDMAPYFEAKNQ